MSAFLASLKTKSIEDPLTSDLGTLITVFVSSFVFFWLCYLVSYVALESLCKSTKKYTEMKSEKKADYLSRVVANIHAVLSCIAAILSFYFTWYVLKITINFSESGKTTLNNDECMMTPYKFQNYALTFSSAYIFYDIFVCFFLMYEISFLTDFLAETNQQS